MISVVINLLETPASTDPAQRSEAHHLIDMLRETAEQFFVPDAATLARRVADQIEAQVGPKTPPRPEEPTGLGAVVEDAEGHRFVRIDEKWWHNSNEGFGCTWERIATLRAAAETEARTRFAAALTAATTPRSHT